MSELDLAVIDKAIALLEAGETRYSCHAIQDAIEYSEEAHAMRVDCHLTAYTKFSAARLGVPVDPQCPWSLDDIYGDKWQWWCETNEIWIPAKIENLKLFKAAIEQGEVK